MSSNIGQKVAEALTMKDGFLYLTVQVKPGATSDSVIEINKTKGFVSISVTAPPRHEKCNQGVCKLIAKVFNVKVTDVSVSLGDEDLRKVVRIQIGGEMATIIQERAKEMLNQAL